MLKTTLMCKLLKWHQKCGTRCVSNNVWLDKRSVKSSCAKRNSGCLVVCSVVVSWLVGQLYVVWLSFLSQLLVLSSCLHTNTVRGGGVVHGNEQRWGRSCHLSLPGLWQPDNILLIIRSQRTDGGRFILFWKAFVVLNLPTNAESTLADCWNEQCSTSCVCSGFLQTHAQKEYLLPQKIKIK